MEWISGVEPSEQREPSAVAGVRSHMRQTAHESGFPMCRRGTDTLADGIGMGRTVP